MSIKRAAVFCHIKAFNVRKIEVKKMREKKKMEEIG